MAERNPRTPRIALVVGGCFKAIAQHPAMVDAHRVVYIDAYSETDDVAMASELVPIDLARDETVRSLCARFDGQHSGRAPLPGHEAHLERVIATMGCKSVDLAKGLGQVPAVAYLAWQTRLSQGLTSTFRAMIDDLTIRAGGQLTRIEIDVFHSNAGATGRGIANAAVETICELFAGRTVSVTHYVVGRMSFTGLGSHVHDNAPLGVLEDMAFQKQPPTHPKAVHRWLGIELPPVGNDTVLRAHYSALWAQAITAAKTRELLDRPQANRSAAATWGNFTLIRSGWFRSSMTEDDVVAGAARHVLREIDRQLNQVNAPRDGLSVDYQSPIEAASELVGGFPADLQKAAADALNGVLTADNLRALVMQAVHVAEPEVHFRRPSGEEAALGALFRSTPPAGLASLLNDLTQARIVRTATLRALDEETHALVEQGELDRSLRRARRNLDRAIALLCPRTIEEHMRALWYPANRRRLAFLHAAVDYRRVAREHSERQARITALNKLLERTDDLIRNDQEPFQAIRAALNRLLATLPPAVDERSVRYRSLSEQVYPHQTAFEVLLRAARTDSLERLYFELRQTTRGVTLEGLASILRLGPDGGALAIVNRLDRDAEIMGPYWGGLPRPDAETDQRIRVLPPLEGDLYRELEQARDEIGSEIQLVCAESMAGGIGIVYVDTYLVKEWYDLLTPEYQQDLLTTLGDPEATALAHVPGHRLYLDGIFQALHYTPSTEVSEIIGLPVAAPAPEAAAPTLEEA